MKDYRWIRETGEYRASRRAAMFPDEEPDDDMLPARVLWARNRSQESEEKATRKRERGELAPEGE